MTWNRQTPCTILRAPSAGDLPRESPFRRKGWEASLLPCSVEEFQPSGSTAALRPRETEDIQRSPWPEMNDASISFPGCSIGSARTIPLDRSCWLRFLPQEHRCSLVTGLESARASLSPRLAKASATPSLSSQLNRSGSGTNKLHPIESWRPEIGSSSGFAGSGAPPKIEAGLEDFFG